MGSKGLEDKSECARGGWQNAPRRLELNENGLAGSGLVPIGRVQGDGVSHRRAGEEDSGAHHLER